MFETACEKILWCFFFFKHTVIAKKKYIYFFTTLPPFAIGWSNRSSKANVNISSKNCVDCATVPHFLYFFSEIN